MPPCRCLLLSSIVSVCLSVTFVSCGGDGGSTCIDSMDCAFGLACREAKCVSVKCVSPQACISGEEICADLLEANEDSSRRSCTAPCNVFHKCPSGQYCSNKICQEGTEPDSDVKEGVQKDVQEDGVLSDAFTDLGRDTGASLDDSGIHDVKDDGTGDDGITDIDAPDTNIGPDTNAPDISGQDTNACVPSCDGQECGLDPVCGVFDCGLCFGSDACVDGECVWQEVQHAINCSDGMCLIPAGLFWMGCNETVDTQCYGDENPYHQVSLSAYYIDKTEVTQNEYKKCVDAGVCDAPGCNWNPVTTPNRPVVCVNWAQADEYCKWVGKRLPTEAEWEKAARGTDGRKYPWGNETATCELAVMDGCPGDAMDVCSKSPAGDSPYGLCDMAGNVWEWVSDWYDSGYYTNSSASNPTGPVSGSSRVRRGGSFVTDVGRLRASLRYYADPSRYYGNLGFRCARDAL